MNSYVIAGACVAILGYLTGCWVSLCQRTLKEPTPPSKPPLGVMPRYIWLELRADDLRGAIARYNLAFVHTDKDVAVCALAKEWKAELRHIEAELMDLPERRMLPL